MEIKARRPVRVADERHAGSAGRIELDARRHRVRIGLGRLEKLAMSSRLMVWVTQVVEVSLFFGAALLIAVGATALR
ncbi:MAG TPA: hypothetical protein PKB10_11355 [Tepidisphaeraceae bacterium]|nr:hypothetical protein [Tepidisphaeraceae bacterium]